MPTQFDDAFLTRLAHELADIRIHIGAMRALLGLLGVSLDDVDRQIVVARTHPDAQRAAAMILRQLQGGQP